VKEPPFILDLRDLMDGHYGPNQWTERTGVGQGSDIGPALTDGLKTLRATFGRGKILIPPGSWLMTQAPAAADLSGHVIEGVGSQASVIVYNNAGGAAFWWSGAGGYSGGGMHGIGLMLEQGFGQSSAYGIIMKGDATCQPDMMRFSDIYMSAVGAQSYWWENIHIDGSARSSPQGVRESSFDMVHVFNAHNLGMYIANGVQVSFNNFGIYTGQGTYANTLLVTGGSIQVRGVSVQCTVTVGNASNVKIDGTTYA